MIDESLKNTIAPRSARRRGWLPTERLRGLRTHVRPTPSIKVDAVGEQAASSRLGRLRAASGCLGDYDQARICSVEYMPLLRSSRRIRVMLDWHAARCVAWQCWFLLIAASISTVHSPSSRHQLHADVADRQLRSFTAGAADARQEHVAH